MQFILFKRARSVEINSGILVKLNFRCQRMTIKQYNTQTVFFCSIKTQKCVREGLSYLVDLARNWIRNKAIKKHGIRQSKLFVLSK